MARIKEFPLPDLGEGLTEGEILKWLVGVGDTIELNQPIVEVETAKAAVEIPAKWAGQVSAIFHGEGETVEVGTAIIAIDTDPSAGPLPQDGGSGGSPTKAPSPEGLGAVEIAPEEGMVEPGLIGGPAPGGRTAVLVGYGPKNTVAKRRARKTDPAAPGPAAAPPAPAPVAGAAPQVVEAPQPAETTTNGTRPLAKPPVRKLARDLGVD